MCIQVTSLSGGDTTKNSTRGMSLDYLYFGNDFCSFRELTLCCDFCSFRELTVCFNVDSLNPENPVQVSLDHLTAAIYDLLRLHANSSKSSADCPQSSRSIKEAWTATEQLQFTVYAAHGISSNWVSK